MGKFMVETITELDEEWVELIFEALEAGLSHDHIRSYFREQSNPVIKINAKNCPS